MFDFKSPAREDLPLLRKICENYGTMGCDFNSSNIYLWRKRYNIKICFYDGMLVLSYFRDNVPWGYCFPIGEGDPTRAIAEIFRDAKQRGVEAAFVMLTDAQKEKLVAITGYEYDFEELTGDEDYIYTNYDLSLLPGKKYHSKRNHISKFDRTYPKWSFQIISRKHFRDVMTVLEKWCDNNDIDRNSFEEYSALKEALDNYELLQLHGGILYVDETPAAFAIGSRINQNTFDVSFEKGLVEYEGVYSKINNEFAKTLIGFEFINREEDMGIESLRKSKLSYHPVVILKRFKGVKKNA